MTEYVLEDTTMTARTIDSSATVTIIYDNGDRAEVTILHTHDGLTIETETPDNLALTFGIDGGEVVFERP